MKKEVHLYNGDSLDILEKMDTNNSHNNFFDAVISSPPYSYEIVSSKKDFRMKGINNETEYIERTIKYFKHFDKVVKKNGLVIWNLSYFNDNPGLPIKTISSIMNEKDLNWTLIDTISWFKNSYIKDMYEKEGIGARLGRTVELIFIFARKNTDEDIEKDSTIKHWTSSYKIHPTDTRVNYIDTSQKGKQLDDVLKEASKNIGCPTTATYAESLITELLNIYKSGERINKQPWVNILDPFAGTGTSGVVCMKQNLNFYGMEIDSKCVASMVYRFRQLKSDKYDIYVDEELCTKDESIIKTDKKRKRVSKKCEEINKAITYGLVGPESEKRIIKKPSLFSTSRKPKFSPIKPLDGKRKSKNIKSKKRRSKKRRSKKSIKNKKKN